MPDDEVPPIAVVSRPGDTDRVLHAMQVIHEALGQVRGEPLRVVLDALISLYLGLAIRALGIEKTDAALRLQRKNLVRIAEAIRANQSPPAGRA